MTAILFSMIAALAALGAGASGRPQIDGTWVITKNSVHHSRVQAYDDNDDRIVGGRLRIDSQRITFSGKDSVLTASCDVKKIVTYGHGRFDVLCRNGRKFGPDIAEHLFRSTGSALIVRWFDGLTLTLKREPTKRKAR